MSDKVNILLVDDLPDKLLVLESVLEELGENIVIARTGEEALRQVLDHEFAVILLDVNMPGMDGFETATYIRRRRKSAHTPIIFITAFADELHTAQGYLLGAVDYILSPVVPEVLRSKVKVFVDLFRMAQQVRRQADERVVLAREQAARAAAEETTRRSNFLAEAGAVLSSTLDLGIAVAGLARVVVPFLADLAAVTLVAEDGELLRTELAWAGTGAELHTASALQRKELPAPLAAAIEQALASDRPLRIGPRENVVPFPRFPASWPLVPSLDNPAAPAEGLALPLQARGRTLGVLSLLLGPSGRHHGPAETALAEDLANRAAVALDNARLYQNIQEADRRKNEFLAMLAHELRNPLAPIRNAVQVLRLLATRDPSQAEARDMIDRQVTHMARLIDDLLDMSRLARGRILLRKERLDLVALVQRTVTDYRPLLEQSGLRLELRLPTQPLYTEGDPTRLAQIVGNVLHNANKFTDAGGTVLVEVLARGEDTAAVVVRDTGIGVEPEMLRQMFETFSQADSSLDRSKGGLGLGLALVRGLVDLHGGRVKAASPGLGQGTEITIELPLCTLPTPAVSSAPALGPIDASYRILIVEDNRDAAESMRTLFTLTGHVVEVAHSGPAGVETAQAFRPEVVLCDIGLPGGMDGYGVARMLRRDPELAATVLIALSGYGQLSDQEQAREAGFDRHLTKPVDFVELQQLIASLMATAQKQPL